MIMKKILIILLMYKFEGVKTQEDPCRPIPFPMDISFDETSSQGSIIFIGGETNSTIQKWTIMENNPRVSIEFISQTYQLVLLQTVDLDVANPDADICYSGLQQFTQRVTCKTSQGVLDDESIRFKISPANEYPPDVIKYMQIRIQEGDMRTPIFIDSMLNLFQDRDCPKEDPKIIISKTTGERDTSEYFTVNSTTGFLYQIKNFDYEETRIKCNVGITGGVLSITAKDGPHTVSTILNVTFVDVDDTPPVFVRSGCSTTCYTCPISDISVTIHYLDQGIIKTEPSSIKALDPDTDPSNITYSLDVYPDTYKYNFKFENGNFILRQSFAYFTNFGKYYDFSVRILLRATGSNGQISNNFILTINVTMTSKKTILSTTTVKERKPTGEFCHQTPDESESAKNIAIIVLSISTGVLTVLMVFVFYKMWSARTKPEKLNSGYEEGKRNNENMESVYATITL